MRCPIAEPSVGDKQEARSAKEASVLRRPVGEVEGGSSALHPSIPSVVAGGVEAEACPAIFCTVARSTPRSSRSPIQVRRRSCGAGAWICALSPPGRAVRGNLRRRSKGRSAGAESPMRSKYGRSSRQLVVACELQPAGRGHGCFSGGRPFWVACGRSCGLRGENPFEAKRVGAR